MPRPIGLFRSVNAPVFDVEVHKQVQKAISTKGRGTLQQLVYSGEMWNVD
jgi:2-oxoglutarate ferredoxin oxidoreductase subunit beta